MRRFSPALVAVTVGLIVGQSLSHEQPALAQSTSAKPTPTPKPTAIPKPKATPKPTPSPTPAPAQRFVSPNGFSFVPPAGWSQDIARTPPPRALFVGPKDSGYFASCLVSTGDSGEMTIDTYIQNLQDGDIKTKQLTLLDKIKRGKIDNIPTALIKSKRIHHDLPIVQWQFLSVSNGKTVVLTVSVAESAAKNYDKVVDTMIKSFRWEK